MFLFYTPRKHKKIIGFLVFLRVLNGEHWPEMGYYMNIPKMSQKKILTLENFTRDLNIYLLTEKKILTKIFKVLLPLFKAFKFSNFGSSGKKKRKVATHFKHTLLRVFQSYFSLWLCCSVRTIWIVHHFKGSHFTRNGLTKIFKKDLVYFVDFRDKSALLAWINEWNQRFYPSPKQKWRGRWVTKINPPGDHNQAGCNSLDSLDLNHELFFSYNTEKIL